MRAARLYGPRDLRIEEIPTPVPGPGEILCKVVTCGMCGTDYSIYTGEVSFIGAVRFPMTPGHEWSGTVERVGDGVTGFSHGDRVTGDTIVCCGVCYECLVGNYNRCGSLRAVGTVRTWDGGYAQYVLMPARHLFKLPENVDFDSGALVEPAATALYSVVLSEMMIGDIVLVQGTGPIGIAAAKLAKLAGATKVIITGRKDYKLKVALGMGIDYAVNTTTTSLAEGIEGILGTEKVDRVIEASGSTQLFQESFAVTRSGGVISVVAFYDKALSSFNLDNIIYGDVTIRPVPGSLGMYKPTLRLMDSGMLDLTPIITGRYRLEQVHQALEDMGTKNGTRIKFMLDLP